jgi:hypothetical protein
MIYNHHNALALPFDGAVRGYLKDQKTIFSVMLTYFPKLLDLDMHMLPHPSATPVPTGTASHLAGQASQRGDT